MKKQQTFCESYLAKAQYLCTIDDRHRLDLIFCQLHLGLDQDLIERNLDELIRGSKILEILHGLPLIKEYLLHAELLQSYSSLTLKCMAQAFGSSDIFLDKELSRFIASGN
ncbi:unnamed protein product [Adineta steineri]|uniref:Uncharacterized protein n=1 Tax=Adineta steineri TaxID=433720 RepID=A0A813NDE6_9BILA|nr:unnamed protein product [Adineta steineri]CAF3945302.1 unnamed protein product [Adineta steineri]